MKRRPRHRSSPSNPQRKRTNGSKHKPTKDTAHSRERVKGCASLRRWLKAYGRGADARIARQEFAKRVGTTLPYLVHLVLGNRLASIEMAARIEQATHGIVRAEELRPSKAWAVLRHIQPPAQL